MEGKEGFLHKSLKELSFEKKVLVTGVVVAVSFLVKVRIEQVGFSIFPLAFLPLIALGWLGIVPTILGFAVGAIIGKGVSYALYDGLVITPLSVLYDAIIYGFVGFLAALTLRREKSRWDFVVCLVLWLFASFVAAALTPIGYSVDNKSVDVFHIMFNDLLFGWGLLFSLVPLAYYYGGGVIKGVKKLRKKGK